jgi:GNAT superfamily N-acetyltransferase
MNETRIEMVRADDPRFLALCGTLDEYLDEASGREKQRAFYDQYNRAADLLTAALAIENGAAVGCGGIKAHGDKTAELKRMFVCPESRGKKIGARIVHALAAEARARGFEKLILETGNALVPAQKLYLGLGFHVIENFGQYRGLENSVCMEMTL